MDQGRTILIIEDDEAMRIASRSVLEENGFTVIEARDGEDGLAKTFEISPDLVLCDIEMPRKNGFEVLRMFRANAATMAVPFVFLTGQSARTAMRKGMELGADDFLTKPFTMDELLSTVKGRLERRVKLQEEAKEKLDELRQNISSAVPHELRTPLTGILGFGAILREQAASLGADDIRDIADHVLGSGQRLQRTLEKFWKYSEIVFLSRDEGHRNTIRSESLEKAQAAIRVAAREFAGNYGRENDLQLSLDSDLCLQMRQEHLTALLHEVLDNAFKFSKAETAVIVSSRLEAERGRAVIEIQDHGHGMSKLEVEQIGGFMQFGRKRHEQQGLGLGLSIARELTRLYEGEMSISSEEGKGTTVTIDLPLC